MINNTADLDVLLDAALSHPLGAEEAYWAHNLLIFRAVPRELSSREACAGSQKLDDQEVIAIESTAKISVEEMSRKADAFYCLVHLKMN